MLNIISFCANIQYEMLQKVYGISSRPRSRFNSNFADDFIEENVPDDEKTDNFILETNN